MLSFSRESSTDADWHLPFQRLLPSGCDINNEAEIRQVFAEGVDWAKENDVPHKKNAAEYADQYIRSFGTKDHPVIPEFMRRYIAHKLEIECSDGSLGGRTSNPDKQKSRPSVRRNMNDTPMRLPCIAIRA